MGIAIEVEKYLSGQSHSLQLYGFGLPEVCLAFAEAYQSARLIHGPTEAVSNIREKFPKLAELIQKMRISEAGSDRMCSPNELVHVQHGFARRAGQRISQVVHEVEKNFPHFLTEPSL